MSDHKNVRIETETLDKIDTLHSKAFNRQMMVNMLLESAVQQWEEWLNSSGEIEVCKRRRVGEYQPIFNCYKKTFPYSKELLDKQEEIESVYDA